MVRICGEVLHLFIYSLEGMLVMSQDGGGGSLKGGGAVVWLTEIWFYKLLKSKERRSQWKQLESSS